LLKKAIWENAKNKKTKEKKKMRIWKKLNLKNKG
jgi:hypothetical protein